MNKSYSKPNQIKPHRFFALMGLFLFLIVAITSIIPISDDMNWLSLKLNNIKDDKSVFNNIKQLTISYSLKNIVYTSNSNNSIIINNGSGTGQIYKFPIICQYNQTYNIENYHVCNERNLEESTLIINSVILLNCGITVCSIAFIIVQLIIDFKILKQIQQQHFQYKIWAIAFRLSFLIPMCFSIVSTVVFAIEFPKSVSNQYPTLFNDNNWQFENGFTLSLLAMVISICSTCFLISSFYILYKKFKNTIYFRTSNGSNYSLLYV